MISGLNQVPMEDFKKLGISERQLIDNRSLLVALLSGKRSELMPVTIQLDKDRSITQDVKLSFTNEVRENGKFGLKVHPVREKMERVKDLTVNESNKLERGGTVVKQMENENGEKNNYIFQRDRQTNEVLKVNTKDLNFPLTKNDLAKIRRDESIAVGGKNIKMDLSSSKGYSEQPRNIQQERNKGADLRAGTTFTFAQKSGDYVIQSVKADGRVSYSSVKKPDNIQETTMDRLTKEIGKVLDKGQKNDQKQSLKQKNGFSY